MASHRIELMGREFRIRSEDEPQHVARAADYVNDQVAEISQAAAQVPPQGVALLAALSIADELLKLRAEHEALRDRLRTRSQALLERMSA